MEKYGAIIIITGSELFIQIPLYVCQDGVLNRGGVKTSNEVPNIQNTM